MSDLRRELQALQKQGPLLNYGAVQLGRSPHLRDSAARDALTLLLHTLGTTHAQFYANPDGAITPEQEAAYDDAIARRLKNEPIQYITGEQEFYGLTLRVTPAVLIPRPETEHLVEAVLMELADRSKKNDAVIPSEEAQRTSRGAPAFASDSEKQPLRILDIGTGSGAIAIALARHLPQARVTATDISPAALAVARENAARHNVQIDFLQSDLLDNLSEERATQEAEFTREVHRERYEVLVSNPPYVPETERPTLHPQVRDYEPAAALYAGEEGLAVYRRLVPQARAALAPNGLLALEIGHGQRDAIAAQLADWKCVRFVDDLQGIPRVAIARRPE